MAAVSGRGSTAPSLLGKHLQCRVEHDPALGLLLAWGAKGFVKDGVVLGS